MPLIMPTGSQDSQVNTTLAAGYTHHGECPAPIYNICSLRGARGNSPDTSQAAPDVLLRPFLAARSPGGLPSRPQTTNLSLLQPHSNQTIAQMYNEPLTAIGQRIHRTFGVLEARLTRDLPAVTLQPESQRFERWGGDAGLYDQGRSSLDRRFREPPSVLSFG